MKRRKFIVLVDGAAAASQDGSIASVYLRAVTRLTERSTGIRDNDRHGSL
jgi:hypothetical protein